MYSHMQRRPVTDCRCTSQNYKEPFRFMLGTQVLIGRHIRSRSLAWLYYDPNFVGSFSDFCQGGTNVSLLSRSFIVQFLSLLSAWLSSRSVSLISETFFGQNFAPVSLRIFVRVKVKVCIIPVAQPGTHHTIIIVFSIGWDATLLLHYSSVQGNINLRGLLSLD